MMRLACAVSCTPGSSTTTRFVPWRWMIGSATPISLIRLRSVPTFCSIALLTIWLTSASGTLALTRSEEHTSELQSLMRISYAVFCLQKKTPAIQHVRDQPRHETAHTKTHTRVTLDE